MATGQKRAARARPAASIMCVWRDPSGLPSIFMGKRDALLVFMPGFLVFPGGRVERQDADNPCVDLLDKDSIQALEAESTTSSPHAFARAAMRECLEETGLDLKPYLTASLTYIARAITPLHLPKRYDTRFFLAAIRPGAHPPQPESKGDGELQWPGWYTLDTLRTEPLHHVTRAVLDHGLKSGVTTQPRLLVADRKPKRWSGSPPLRSRHLKAALKVTDPFARP